MWTWPTEIKKQKKRVGKERRDGGRMVSALSAVTDSSTALTKREILPIGQRLIFGTHMTDAQSHFLVCSLQWVLKFADCTLHPQLYFTAEKNEMRNCRQNGAGEVHRSPAADCNDPASTDNVFLMAAVKKNEI